MKSTFPPVARRFPRFLFCFVTIAATVGCGSEEQVLDDATVHFLAADAAMEAGDNETALTELNTAIDISPDIWSYYRRGKLHAEMGNDEAAVSDCKLGLAINPNHQQLKWLEKELKKPASRRFKGTAKQPKVDK